MAGATFSTQSGVAAQETIYNGSLFLQYMMKPGKGRNVVISGEQFDYGKRNQIGMTFVDRSQFILLTTIYPEIYMFSRSPLLRESIKGYFRYITETTRAVTGFQDPTLDVSKPTFKNNFLNLPMFTNQSNPTTELSFQIPAELAGYFITRQTAHWMNAISDPNSRGAHYNDTGIPFNNYSHSGGMVYIKPDKTYTRVDWGCLIFLMVPLSAPYNLFDADASNPGVPEIELKFTANIVDISNVKVNEICRALLAKYKNHIVIDSGIFGAVKNTWLSMVEEINVDDVFAKLAG